VEIYQNCNIFNDGAFDELKQPQTRDDYLIRLEHGQPIIFGPTGEPDSQVRGRDGKFCVVHPPGGFGLEVRETSGVAPEDIVVHDAGVAEPAYAFALSRLPGFDLRNTPIGVFRDIDRPSYDGIVQSQLETARTKSAGTPEEQFTALLNSGDTWTIL
jgi:2-oxoglutarate ferredoxin oxidoreductase subunit beta